MTDKSSRSRSIPVLDQNFLLQTCYGDASIMRSYNYYHSWAFLLSKVKFNMGDVAIGTIAYSCGGRSIPVDIFILGRILQRRDFSRCVKIPFYKLFQGLHNVLCVCIFLLCCSIMLLCNALQTWCIYYSSGLVGFMNKRPEFCYCSKDAKCSNCIRFEAVRKRCLYCKPFVAANLKL